MTVEFYEHGHPSAAWKHAGEPAAPVKFAGLQDWLPDSYPLQLPQTDKAIQVTVVGVYPHPSRHPGAWRLAVSTLYMSADVICRLNSFICYRTRHNEAPHELAEFLHSLDVSASKLRRWGRDEQQSDIHGFVSQLIGTVGYVQVRNGVFRGRPTTEIVRWLPKNVFAELREQEVRKTTTHPPLDL